MMEDTANHSGNEDDDEDEEDEEYESSTAGDEDVPPPPPSATSPALAAVVKAWVKDPRPTDIICGRGARASHPGNQRFREVVLSRKREYQLTKRREDKTRIALEIVNVLMGGTTPARFLLKDAATDHWYDVGVEYAKEKVSHALRSRPNSERRKRLKSKQQQRAANNNNNGKGSTPQLEDLVSRLISDQQQLLETLIRTEVPPLSPGAAS